MKRLAHYSQYFLRSPVLIKELVGHSSIKRSDLVYDIGAGSGVIASVLATSCRQVIAVEAEPRMAAKLRANVEKYKNITVQEGDFLKLALPEEPYKVFANIPFHLSSPIVRRLTEATYPPDAIYLVVQKQFANKLLPDTDTFTGQLGIMIGPLFAARIRKRLKRTDFWPHPNVDTVFLELAKREQPLLAGADMPAYRRFVSDCFSDPKIFATMPVKALGFEHSIRPSQMKLAHWLELFLLAKKKSSR